MKTLLWLDDVRNPHENDWLKFSPIGKDVNVVWVKSYDEFVDFIQNKQLPDGICFDHDLGVPRAEELRKKGMSKKKARMEIEYEKTGADCARWLVNFYDKHQVKLPPYNVHSANPWGKQNIINILQDHLKTHCVECGGTMKQSKVMINGINYSEDFGNDKGEVGTTFSYTGPAKLVDGWKCIKCGHSYTI